MNFKRMKNIIFMAITGILAYMMSDVLVEVGMGQIMSYLPYVIGGLFLMIVLLDIVEDRQNSGVEEI